MITMKRCRKKVWLVAAAVAALCICLAASSPDTGQAGQAAEEVEDATGRYHFLSPEDTLALLEEDGKLKGYVDVVQSEEESDAVLSYTITIGSRKKDRVEFKTNRIHQRYYRFAGRVQRGSGHEEKAPDFLRLIGDLEIVSINPETGKETVERRHVILKSVGKNEREEE